MSGAEPPSSPPDNDGAGAGADADAPPPRPRVWFLASADSAIGIAVARQVIQNGDIVVAGALSAKSGRAADDQAAEFDAFVASVRATHDPAKRQMLVVGLNTRLVGDCQAAVAEAVRHFGRIDVVLCCTTEALFGTVEELAAGPRTVAAVHDQFNSNLFGPVHAIKAVLPVLRRQHAGHILVLTGITAHIGTPGLSAYCASQWALEGFCDSLAYEIAPFNVRLSIIQASIEVAVLTNHIVAVPSMPEYAQGNNPAPLSRSLFAGLLDRMDGAGPAPPPPEQEQQPQQGESPSSRGDRLLRAATVNRIPPRLPAGMREKLLAETLHALMAIGGHPNPPARHIVGHEGVASVKEKLKTVSEELEEFVHASEAVDF